MISRQLFKIGRSGSIKFPARIHQPLPMVEHQVFIEQMLDNDRPKKLCGYLGVHCFFCWCHFRKTLDETKRVAHDFTCVVLQMIHDASLR